jgi:hypothetical protein
MSSLLADRAVLPAEMAARVSQLEADFAVQFGQRPQLLVRVPGRVNLIGKHGRYENIKAESFTPLLSGDRKKTGKTKASTCRKSIFMSSFNPLLCLSRAKSDLGWFKKKIALKCIYAKFIKLA